MKISEFLLLVDSLRLRGCLSQARISKELMIATETYCRVMRGKNKPSYSTLGAMIQFVEERGYKIVIDLK